MVETRVQRPSGEPNTRVTLARSIRNSATSFDIVDSALRSKASIPFSREREVAPRPPYTDLVGPVPGLRPGYGALTLDDPRVRPFYRYKTVNSSGAPALACDTSESISARWLLGAQEKFSRDITYCYGNAAAIPKLCRINAYSAGCGTATGRLRRCARFNCHIRKPVMAKSSGRKPERNTKPRHISPRPCP